MKKVILPAIAALVLAVTFNSCSMEKRHYMKGFYIERNGHKEITATPSKHQVAVENAAVAEIKKESAPVTTIVAAEENVAVQPVAAPVNNTPVVSNKAVVEKIKSSAPVTTVKADKKSDRPTISKGKASKQGKPASQMPDKGLLIVLAIFIPWLAVGLATDWEAKPLIINLLLSLTCIGAIIHAIVVVNKNA